MGGSVCVCVPTVHLQVAVDNAHVVQVLDSIEDLPDQGAGVPLGVETLLHDAVKELSPRDPVGSGSAGQHGPPGHPRAPRRHSQLHDEVEVGATLVDVIQGHDVGVLDPAGGRYGAGEGALSCPPLWPPLDRQQPGSAPWGITRCRLFWALPITPGDGCWQQGAMPGAGGDGTEQDPHPHTRTAPPYLWRTAISFSMLVSFPSSAFLAMHLMATSFCVAFSSARTTSEKAPLRGRGGGKG